MRGSPVALVYYPIPTTQLKNFVGLVFFFASLSQTETKRLPNQFISALASPSVLAVHSTENIVIQAAVDRKPLQPQCTPTNYIETETFVLSSK